MASDKRVQERDETIKRLKGERDFVVSQPHVVHNQEPPVVMTQFRDTVVIAKGRDIFEMRYDMRTDAPELRHVARI